MSLTDTEHIQELYKSLIFDKEIEETINFISSVEDKIFKSKVKGFFYVSNDEEFRYQEVFDIDIIVTHLNDTCIIVSMNIPFCSSIGKNKKEAIENFLKTAAEVTHIRFINDFPLSGAIARTSSTQYSFPDKLENYSYEEVIEKMTEVGWNKIFKCEYSTVLINNNSQVTFNIPNHTEISSNYVASIDANLYNINDIIASSDSYKINPTIQAEITQFTIATLKFVKPALLKQQLESEEANNVIEELIPILWIKAAKEEATLKNERFSSSTIIYSKNFEQQIIYCSFLIKKIKVDLRKQHIYKFNIMEIINIYLVNAFKKMEKEIIYN